MCCHFDLNGWVCTVIKTRGNIWRRRVVPGMNHTLFSEIQQQQPECKNFMCVIYDHMFPTILLLGFIFVFKILEILRGQWIWILWNASKTILYFFVCWVKIYPQITFNSCKNVCVWQGDIQQLLITDDPTSAQTYCQDYIPDCEAPLPYDSILTEAEEVKFQQQEHRDHISLVWWCHPTWTVCT